MKSLKIICGLIFIPLSGCASNMAIFDSDGTAMKGIPVRSPETYVESGTFTKSTKEGANCTPTTYAKPVQLATGKLYYINIAPAQLAKSEFTVKLNDAGQLQEVTMNTQPSADPIKTVADALTSVLPFAGVAPAKASEAGGAAPSAVPACDTGTDPTTISYRKLADVIK